MGQLVGGLYLGKRAAIYAERDSQWLILAICGEMEQPTFQKGVAIHAERVSHMQKGDNLNTTKDDSIRDSKNKIVLLNLFVTSTFCLPQKCFLYPIRIFFLNLGHSTSNRRQVLQGFLQYLLCFPKNKNHVYFILFLFPTPYEVREMLNIEEEKIKQISFGLVEIGQIFSFALFGEYAIDKQNLFWFKRGVGERLPQFVFVFLLLISC